MRLLAATLLFASLVAPGAANADDLSPDRAFTHSNSVMGTIVSVTLWTDDEHRAAAGARAVFAEFRRVNEVMSSWLDKSDVSRINAAAGKQAVAVSDEVFSLIEVAQRAARTTGGAFDITVGAFRGLWKFDQDRDGTIPSARDVKARAALVGYRAIKLLKGKTKRVKLARVGQRITLGGIAKGYAVDRAVAILHEQGFTDFLLQAGGDLYVSGKRGDRKWRVGIRDPRGAADSPFAVAEIEDATFSTSGDYERSVVIDGTRYHHILDPATGFPAKKSRSVTVMAARAVDADIWSTALFVLGPEAGMKLCEKTPGIEAVFVGADNRVHVSTGLQKIVHILRPPGKGP